MGGNLCTLHQPCCSKLGDEDENSIEEPTIEEFAKATKKLVKSEKKVMPTLEQWMLSDPYPSDACKIKKQSVKVSAVSTVMGYERVYSTPRESFSADWSVVSSSLSRKSLNGQRRVSFKLPEEADIHIFYACDDDTEEKECGL